MTQEEKELLIKEISTRLPYGVKAKVFGWDEEKGEVEVTLRIYSINTDGYVYFETNDYDVNYLNVDDFSLYLRPMSSITEEEKNDYNSKFEGREFSWELYYGSTDWLNAHHCDYCGLIEKGLALEAPEGMYNIKEE